ncbi:MAG TPA: hypothetical protein VKC54_04410 [Patescibacteria group bacterium]|nr:hypothetical protein [Patescibacteria group bacterium]
MHIVPCQAVKSPIFAGVLKSRYNEISPHTSSARSMLGVQKYVENVKDIL